MNYIKEINAFYDTLERITLSTSAVSLWHALMHINNKAYWPTYFTAAASILQHKARLTESSFKRARKELVDKGFITYTKGTPHQAPTYEIACLAQSYETSSSEPPANAPEPATSDLPSTQNATPTDEPSASNEEQDPTEVYTQRKKDIPTKATIDSDQHDPNQPHLILNPTANGCANPNTGRSANPQPDRHPAPLLNETKPNQTKPNNNNPTDQTPTDAIQFYEQNVGIASPFVAESIFSWTRDIPEALVIHAMERSLEQGKPNWGYTKAILKSWHHQGIQTVEAARADAVQFRNQNGHAKPPQSTEVIPEWFRALEQQKKQPPTPQPTPPKDEQTALAEAQAMLDAITQKS